MSNFIKFGLGANETRMNKQDIVSIKREPSSRAEITYRTFDPTGENPYIIERISVGVTEREYQKMIEIIDED